MVGVVVMVGVERVVTVFKGRYSLALSAAVSMFVSPPSGNSGNGGGGGGWC